MAEEPVKKKNRTSRFAELGAQEPDAAINSVKSAPINPAIASAAERAAAISKALTPGISAVTNPALNTALSSSALQANIRVAEMQARLAAEIASVSSLLTMVHGNKAGAVEARKPVYKALLLDSQGREIDEMGNLVRQDTQVKTLAANVAVLQAQKKKENPYLAHRTPPPAAIPAAALPYVPPGVAAAAMAAAAAEAAAPPVPVEVVDERLILTNRERRGKKSLSFAEPGKYVQEADEIRLKEERKIIAGYSSGRKAPEVVGEVVPVSEEGVDSEGPKVVALPPPVDEGLVPSMEWWDEAFLPKQVREARKRSRAAAENDDFTSLSIVNVKTYKYVQHPVAIKALGGEKPEQPLPMYLTKKERKRIRKTAREERERDKRDKIMMGLIPAAEPKFKLSNFMKVLGDQAIADPSKVEMRVLQQMQQRQMNHEMRNQAAKLTPAERSAKRQRKLQEDTTRQVFVAVFRVWNLANPRHRFKVDVNAQQHFLSGIVLINQETNESKDKLGCNLVVVEGGPKGIRKFIKLMTSRIQWQETVSEQHSSDATGSYSQEGQEGQEGYDHDDDADDDDNEHDLGQTDSRYYAAPEDGTLVDGSKNKCMLVWQGIVPKRSFVGFKFQECRTAAAGRKLLETKGVVHYWDMAWLNQGV